MMHIYKSVDGKLKLTDTAEPGWQLGSASACIFSIILHEKSLLGVSPAASFSYNLTKNLTGQVYLTESILAHQI